MVEKFRWMEDTFGCTVYNEVHINVREDKTGGWVHKTSVAYTNFPELWRIFARTELIFAKFFPALRSCGMRNSSLV